MDSISLAAATDPGVFAAEVLGQPLWDYQLAIAYSPATVRVVCAGRQVGKSVTLAALSLFEAITRPNILVLIVSAGEDAAKRLLAECARLANNSELLADVLLDDFTNLITFDNGSTIRSVPASEKQIRGWSVDLLILDEAGFISNEIYEVAEPSIIAKPGSRIIMVSSPWGNQDHFFRRMWNLGMDHPDEWCEAWHLPTSASPNVDPAKLEKLRQGKSEDYFNREFLAQWTDGAGQFFSEDELMDCVADYRMCKPEDLEWWTDQRYAAAGGIDWGYSHDANSITLVSVLEDYGKNSGTLGDRLPIFIPWFEYHHRMYYVDFVSRIVDIAKRYYLPVVASETNGVGQAPTQMLQDAMSDAGFYAAVAPVVTDIRRKQSGFGMIKGLLQSKRLVLPRDPELLKQLRGLEFEQLPGGSLRIAVPDRVGHDDVAMSFMQAVSSVQLTQAVRRNEFGSPQLVPPETEWVTTKGGINVPVNARPVSFHRQAFGYPRGSEAGEGW